ncbi:MAG: type VI secretion system accessory protein TagJ [Planctomycetaceae bacterium]
MTAVELLRSGRPTEALAALKDQIRAEPAEAKHRVFLFQLLCVEGDWSRALTQLNLSAEMDPAALAMVQTYREAIQCETLRCEVFAGARTPLVFGEPPGWLGLLLEALRLGASGEAAASQELRGRAFEAAETVPAVVDDVAVDWIADADPRLGPVLEAIVNGRYFWIPFANIRRIDLDPPEDLRDCVWMPAHFEWVNGGDVVGLIPTRYPGSESSDDEAIRLARKTEWNDVGAELFVGLGQRTFATPDDEYPLMNVRRIVFHPEADDRNAADG